MAGFWTLDDALNMGQGIERPFRCPDHDDSNASASVNVLKGVWVCLAPKTRVLASDLRWVEIGSVKTGDKLAGFDETNKAGRRQWRDATVEATSPVLKICYEVVLSDGTEIIASADHQWLTYTPGKTTPEWRTTSSLYTRNGNPVSLMRLTNTWEESRSWESGYAAGAWDGEGTYQSRKEFADARSRQTRLIYYQTDNAMLTEMERCLKELEIPFSKYLHQQRIEDRREHHKPMNQLVVQYKHEVLRALGTTRPQRLLEKFSFDELGSIYPIDKPQVVSVRNIGQREVIAVQTSTRTFVAEGLASHNCYACNAAGAVKDRKAPTAVQLAAMLHPEEACRVYPESWLELFLDADYWQSRFPDWLCWHLGFGSDPFTGDATFPVRTAEGKLAGVGRRLENPAEDEPRYKYPVRWSASRTMFGNDRPSHRDPVGIVVEGAADNGSLRECGFDVFSCLGSGIHAPQYELMRRMDKKIWLLGFDMDEAGERGTEAAMATLSPEFPGRVARIEWPEKDPADTPYARRVAAVHNAINLVGATTYSLDRLIPKWTERRDAIQVSYSQWLEERAA